MFISLFYFSYLLATPSLHPEDEGIKSSNSSNNNNNNSNNNLIPANQIKFGQTFASTQFIFSGAHSDRVKLVSTLAS